MSASSHPRPLVIAYLCLALSVIGAWALPAQAELTTPLTVQWIKSMGPEPDNDMSPLVLGDRLYLTHDGSLYCLDPLTGAQVWKLTVQDVNVSTAPLAWNGTLIIGLDNGYLLAIKPQDGSTVWKTDCGGYIAPTPMIVNDKLILAAQQTVLALNPADGKTKWACSLSSGARNGPITDGTTLYFRCLDGSLQAVDAASGRFRWRVTVPTGAETYPPVMVDRHVLLVEGSMLYAVARTGQITWSQHLPGGVGGPVAVTEESLYVPCLDGHIYLLSPHSGRLQRSPNYEVDGSVTATPVLTSTLLFVGTSGSVIYALDRATGAVRWQYRCRTPEQFVDDASVFGIYSPLVTVNDSLIVLTGGGDLYSLGLDAPDAAGPMFAAFDPEPGDALPGTSTGISVAVFDDGSGVVPDSLTLSVDGTPLKLKFDAASGVATALFSKPKDSIHTVKVTAKDYRGNASSAEWSFLTDETLTPLSEEDLWRQNQMLQRGNQQGGRTQGGRTQGGRTQGGGRNTRGGGGFN